MSRPVQSLAFEVEYWKQINQDLGGLNDDVGAVASSLADAVVAFGIAAVQLAFKTNAREQRSLEETMDGMTAAMERLSVMQKRLAGINEILDGRLAAIRAEMGGEGP